MTSIASAIAGHRLIASSVAVLVAVAALAAGIILSRDVVPADFLGTFAFVVGGSLSFALVGATILVRRPGHRIGRLMMAMGLALGLGPGLATIFDALAPPLIRSQPTVEVIVDLAEEAAFTAIMLGALLLIVWFPDGRVNSRLGTIVQLIVATLAISQAIMIVYPVESNLGFVLLIGAYALALVDLFVRYRHGDELRRMQIRWVLAAGSVTLSLVIALLAFGDRVDWLWQAWIISTILPAIAVGIAITRYHLYEIDRIISRTLTYAGVTVGLFVVFVVPNLIAQAALSRFTGGNAIAVAGSTLLAAAAFSPLRARLQSVVDRRFNRGRYDAEQTIDAFASRLRDQLDLPTVSRALEQTAQAAVEPMSTAVWLRGSPT